jgi:hypothetical protein
MDHLRSRPPKRCFMGCSLATVFRAVLAGVVAAGVSAATAYAQNVRTFVSGHGADSGACGVGSPCRTFAFAITQTIAGGEITILDPAGYGAVAINKAMSIVNDGVGEAAITASTGDAIDIDAAAADVVNLRGLTLVGPGPNFTASTSGIAFNSGGTLNIQNCVIREFIFGVEGNAQGGSLNILDTSITGGNSGLSINGAAALFVDRLVVINPEYGFFFSGSSGGVAGIIANSAVVGANQVSLLGFGANVLIVNSSFIGGTLSGVFESGSGAAYVGGTTLDDAGGAFAGAHNHSYGNNSVVGNIGDVPAAVAAR